MPDPTRTAPSVTADDEVPDWLYLAEHFARLDAVQELLASPTVRALDPQLQHALVHAGSYVLGGWPVVSHCGCGQPADQAPLW